VKSKRQSNSTASLLIVAALIIASCGGQSMTMTEYVERVDAIFDQATQSYETMLSRPGRMVLVVGQGAHYGFDPGGRELSDFSTDDLHVALTELSDIQNEANAAAAAIDPPSEIVELHELFFRRLPIEALAAAAGSTDSWDELSASPEMEAYRSALVADVEVCSEFQAKLDATADRGAFADSPWIPGRLKEIVDYALGCDVFPADPGNVFRP
jgi:hypothetical protein